MNELYVVFHQGGSNPDEVFAVEVHQCVDLVFGAFPVFHTEGVYGEGLDADVDAVLSNGLDGFSALAVAFCARQISFLGPSAVAIHNYGDVSRHPVESQAEPLGGCF